MMTVLWRNLRSLGTRGWDAFVAVLAIVLIAAQCVGSLKSGMGCIGRVEPKRRMGIRQTNPQSAEDRRVIDTFLGLSGAVGIEADGMRSAFILDECPIVRYVGDGVFLFSEGLKRADDSALAALIAHELGHLELGHLEGRAMRDFGVELGISLVADLAKVEMDDEGEKQAIGWVNEITLGSFLLQQELEADLYGVAILEAAGYEERAGRITIETLTWLDGVAEEHAAGPLVPHGFRRERRAVLERAGD